MMMRIIIIKVVVRFIVEVAAATIRAINVIGGAHGEEDTRMAKASLSTIAINGFFTNQNCFRWFHMHAASMPKEGERCKRGNFCSVRRFWVVWRPLITSSSIINIMVNDYIIKRAYRKPTPLKIK
jgi:hypothetical protein